MGLTGISLDGVEAYYAGIATHYTPSRNIGDLVKSLSKLEARTSLDALDILDGVDRLISELCPATIPNTMEESVVRGELRKSIDHCFSAETVPQILSALQSETKNVKWAKNTILILTTHSPISLAVTLRQLRLGRYCSISEALENELQLATHLMAQGDFNMGVTSLLINKPPTQPIWPLQLSEFSKRDIEQFFLVPENHSSLELYNDCTYFHYPHNRYVLPTEAAVKRILNKSNITKQELIKELGRTCAKKPGFITKLTDILLRCTAEHNGHLHWTYLDSPRL